MMTTLGRVPPADLPTLGTPTILQVPPDDLSEIYCEMLEQPELVDNYVLPPCDEIQAIGGEGLDDFETVELGSVVVMPYVIAQPVVLEEAVDHAGRPGSVEEAAKRLVEGLQNVRSTPYSGQQGTPGGTPSSTPGAVPSATPGGTSPGTPGGTPSGTPGGTPSGTPGAVPSGTPGGTPSGTPGGTPSGTPGGTSSGTPGGTPSGTPGGTPSGTPGAVPSATPGGAAQTGRLDPLGVRATVNMEIQGLRGESLVLYWRLSPADGTAALPMEWAEAIPACLLKPTTELDSVSVDLWIPLPASTGPFTLDFIVAQHPGTAVLTSARTASFY